ncbi:hypothetical protein M413DRAFT_7187 [Hebeloma cylindrosporum]|uniref:Uncharacterized protein n=1 Tax=Hebeloma cylindrosporum TaxID=76867 RepID=A0A0C3CWE0_HEBCY|nr:hypothetical protein M413DRAFT_7187 [Hebeloma cylindrosporum h7]
MSAPAYYYNTPYPYFPSPENTSPSPQNFPQTYTCPPPIPTPRLSKPRPPRNPPSSRQIQIAHPYARLLAKKDEVKRRKIWNHALEKFIFSAYELSTLGAPQRRTIYMASLEAHIDRLHAQLHDLGYSPVLDSELDPFKGLNSKTAKSMVAGLQHDASVSKLKLLELQRANGDLQKVLEGAVP